MCFDLRVSLSFQYFTHVIECNAQMSTGTRNRETNCTVVPIHLVPLHCSVGMKPHVN